MNKWLGSVLMVFTLGFSLAGEAQQTCRSESEIPSTTPASRFTDHNDGTVTDNATGLMWSKCVAGLSGSACAQGTAQAYHWQGALNFAESSDLAGYTDWRLPDIKELNSIVEHRCFSPAINESVFPSTPAGSVHSASPAALGENGDYVWRVNFISGSSSYGPRTTGPGFGIRVRLVRGGQ